MTGTITLSDGGQNYIEFDVVDDVITEVRPALLEGWKGCPIKNIFFSVGGSLKVRLWNNYELTLKYKISKIEEAEIEIPLETVTSGVATATKAFRLVDEEGAFVTLGVKAGDIIINTTTGATAIITDIIAGDEVRLDRHIMEAGESYEIARPVE